MDPILPFRALSPGTRIPKGTAPLRNMNSKLSLQTKKKPLADKVYKENKPPPVAVSDLMTSDEDSLSDSQSKQMSSISLRTQDSKCTLPVAESTRYELSDIGSRSKKQSKVQGEDSSSGSTEYFTACPLVGCDDSIVCLSDFKSNSVAKVDERTKTLAISHRDSVLLLSDDDSIPIAKQLYPNSQHSSKLEAKKLYETVVIDESESDENSSVEERECSYDIIIPPSPRNEEGSVADSSLSSSDSSTEQNLRRKKHSHSIVIPPSPVNEEDDDDSNGSNEDVDVNGFRKKLDNSISSGKNAFGAEFNNSSWRKDFHLVLPESSASNEEHDSSPQTHPSPKQVPNTISKEKYNDIARWLFDGRKSSDSSPTSASSYSALSNTTKGLPNCESEVVKHPQVNRLSATRQVSYRNDNNDLSFVEKKKHEKKKKEKKVLNDDSFINDSDSSFAEKTPSVSMYHVDLTKSIRAEVESAKKTARIIKSKKLLSCFEESKDSEEDIIKVPDSESPERPVFKSAKKITQQLFSSDDESSAELAIQEKNSPFFVDSESDHSKTKTKFPLKNKVLTSVESRFIVRKNNCLSSDDDDSENGKSSPVSRKKDKPQEVERPALSVWRRAVHPSDGSSSETSRSSSITPPPRKGGSRKNPGICHQVPPSRKKLPQVTPKKVAALKSPRTPYSPIRTFLSSLSGPSHQAGIRDHPEAGIYNKNFSAKKEELTRRLFKLFNREVFDLRLPSEMVLEWNPRLVRTAGVCHCKLSRRSGISTRSAKIALSLKVITSPDRLRDTLIHEMCHAAVWLLNNVSGGHGPFWKAWASKARKRFPELPAIERCHSYRIETKYTYKCTKCGYSFGRHSKSLDLQKKRCGYCYGNFEVFLSAKNQNQPDQVLKTPKAPTAFALFVKENYAPTKQDNANLKHGDVMKILSAKFAAVKVKK